MGNSKRTRDTVLTRRGLFIVVRRLVIQTDHRTDKAGDGHARRSHRLYQIEYTPSSRPMAHCGCRCCRCCVFWGLASAHARRVQLCTEGRRNRCVASTTVLQPSRIAMHQASGIHLCVSHARRRKRGGILVNVIVTSHPSSVQQ